MLPQIVPVGIDGLSLCGSKASFVQGLSSRPISLLPSSKPHLAPPQEGPPARSRDRLDGRRTGREVDAGQVSHGILSAAWGAKIKRAKQDMLRDASQLAAVDTLPSSRRAGSSGSTAAALNKGETSPAEGAVLGQAAGVVISGDKRDSFAKESLLLGGSGAFRRQVAGEPSLHEKENNPRLVLHRSSEGKHAPARSRLALQAHVGANRGGPNMGSVGGAGLEGALGTAQSAHKNTRTHRSHLRLGSKARVASCPEPRQAQQESTKHEGPGLRFSGQSVHSSKLSRDRLVSTLPAGRQQSGGKDTVEAVQTAVTVAVTAAPAMRRARSADDSPHPDSSALGGGGEGEVEGGEQEGQGEVRLLPKASEREKAPVDLAALQQKARERIAARKKKERMQMEQWEEEQERVKRERVEAKEGANAEAAQRRAAVYALNYLMHQQEWGAWVEFQKEQGIEVKSRPSSKRSRPPSKSKRASSASKSLAAAVPSSAVAPVGGGCDL